VLVTVDSWRVGVYFAVEAWVSCTCFVVDVLVTFQYSAMSTSWAVSAVAYPLLHLFKRLLCLRP